MTRDETIALFLECEAKRTEARAAALASGKSEEEAGKIAHEAAKAHWSAWAEKVLCTREHLFKEGRWAQESASNFGGIVLRREDNVLHDEVTSNPGQTQPPIVVIKGPKIDFSGFKFPGSASFRNATFEVDTSFSGAIFTDEAVFRGAEFSATVDFDDVKFNGTHFRGAKFGGYASFQDATFAGFTMFRGIQFASNTNFSGAIFKKNAYFREAKFKSASFWGTSFGYAMFDATKFCEPVEFTNSKFKSGASFRSVQFANGASFDDVVFTGKAFFEDAIFKGGVTFELTKFKQFVTFRTSRFEAGANFFAISVESGFDMAGTIFQGVPDFIQANFKEAPRLDHSMVNRITIFPTDDARSSNPYRLHIPSRRERFHRNLARLSPTYARVAAASRNTAARWRALRRLAIQGNDTDRELEFHSRELRSQRFAGDWPAPWPIWKARVWSGFFRFYFGIGYEVFSDFGRSLLRPVLAWSIGILAFAAFYLSQTEVLQRDLMLKDVWWGSAAAQAGYHAVSNVVPCYTPTNEKSSDTTEITISGLSEKLRSQTNARAEALNLAFRNALVAIDGGSDASYRIYGCLYGIENRTPIVPSAVSTGSAIQKLISGVLIFLFGLALRNMLKVK